MTNEERTNSTSSFHKLGHYHSWEVLSNSVLIKHCDKSFFDYKGSGIPKEIVWFFGFDKVEPNQKKTINLQFRSKSYNCDISSYHSTELSSYRMRMFWKTDLQEVFNSLFVNMKEYPTLKFEKLSDTKYEIEFVEDTLYSDENSLSKETIITDKEGKKVQYWTTRYERSPINRKKCIELKGTKCEVCGFDFEKTYGELGKDFIEVHHIKPLFEEDEEVEINPETDLVCLCSNCHSMIHRNKKNVLSVEELKTLIKK